VSSSEDKSIRFWDAKSGQVLRSSLRVHNNSITSVAFSPDGKQLVSRSIDSTVSGTQSAVKLLDHFSIATSTGQHPSLSPQMAAEPCQALTLFFRVPVANSAYIKNHQKNIKNLALKSDRGWARNMERSLLYYIPARNLSLHSVRIQWSESCSRGLDGTGNNHRCDAGSPEPRHIIVGR
jgi:WD40 repeat protein